MPKLSDAQVAALRAMCEIDPDDDWILIGASALLCHKLPLRRVTHDVDFVATGHDVCDSLRSADWQQHPKMMQRWQRDDALIDLIIATESDLAAGEVHLDDGFVLSVVGFDLALREKQPIEVEPGLTVDVPHPSVLALLKMISWMERNEREKDLADIVMLFDDGLDELDERRFDPDHAIAESNVDYDDQGAFWLGWELARRAEPSHLHWAHRFVEQMADRDSAAFALMARASEYPSDHAEDRLGSRLDAYALGLQRGWVPRAASRDRTAQRTSEATTNARPARAAAAGGLGRRGAEGRSARTTQMLIHDAIDDRRVLHFRYQGHERVAEPHVLGMIGGQLQLLGFQIDGHSSSGGLPDWRLYKLDEISSLAQTGKGFAGPRPTRGGPTPFDRQIVVVR